MFLQIVAVRDSAVGAFGQPQYVVSVGGATRGFSDEVNRKDERNAMNAHPDDFELYHLGVYNDADASFELFAKPVMVVRAKDVIK